jgi:hypothetical protein
MWQKSQFASWEVEGQVRERVDSALQEAEYGRLAKKAKSGRAPRLFALFSALAAPVSRSLGWLGERVQLVLKRAQQRSGAHQGSRKA